VSQNEQIRVIDGAKTSIKRRKGVAFFVKHVPVSECVTITADD
jgi:hypothetical protein